MYKYQNNVLYVLTQLVGNLLLLFPYSILAL